ncbi:unnamed protein product [Lactuca saligna]|uniref:TIR domain-containing protein n=1 Tax=Lactuca saligna TaxID=75948 RepID=A0AA35ZPH8_LACSI|nr:unnamed protein product [Lactuca saligna]
MASSSSSPSAPAFSSQSWNHDVFLSFRGEDTRKTFVDHLYSALVLQGIDTYKDDETVGQGESIRPSLMKAIEESQIAVIVFSINYADSSWCLDELAHIMKCKDTTGKIVMPIFYDVDPSTLRKQKGKYGEAFAKHKLENKNKVESWKKAIVDASNLSGWEPKNIANGHESKAIKEIVDKISSRLQLVTATANEKLIGMSARVQRLKSELQIGSSGVRMIGIWGVGGGGKTTLASCIYDEIGRKFDGKSIGGGRSLIDKRLRNRRVLIVLDDVDELEQLEVLAGSPDWFGEGSRILITTRDEHLLNAHKVMVHDVSLLSSDEAIKLFRKHAFRGCLPMKDYEELSEEVVSYAGGLPLALTVLGSSLCDKNIDQWKSAIARLKDVPDDKVLEKLKVSFDGLTKIQKDLFLDIACFFRWQQKDWAMERLDACGFHPVIGVEELRQKALITISRGCFDMHDLVQEMGHHIVRGEHPKNPEKHSRVWLKEDVLRLCAMDATMDLDKIEAIQASFLSFTELTQYEGPLPPEVVEHFRVPANREPLSPILANMRNLRYIEWKGDPANPLLNNFPPKELCCLILRSSTQDQLWNGYKVLRNLKTMELYDLDNLIMTPNFDGIPYLEIFRLSRCPKLEEIHTSFGGLDRLVCLSIEECLGIKKFPSITGLKKLETLSFRVSPGVFELSEIQQKMENLGDEDMSSAVAELSKLNLNLNPNPIRSCFFRRDLIKLNLSACSLEDEDIMSCVVWELPNVQELNLSDNNFSRLDFSLMRLPRLKFLDVSTCMYLVELSGLPSSIAVLIALFCLSLKTFGDTSNCKWLWKVSLYGACEVDPLDGWMFLMSMFEGNAIEDHFISGTLQYPIPIGGLGRLFWGNTFTRRLPHGWYNDYSGFLLRAVTFSPYPEFDIIIKQEVHEDSRFEEYIEELEPVLDPRATVTYVGYVSFNSLRSTACLNSTYNSISFSGILADRVGVELVCRKSKDQTTKKRSRLLRILGSGN